MIIRFFSILFVSAWLTACSTSSQPIEAPEELSDFSQEDYSIGVGDQLSVSVWKNPDLSVEAPVRPDGKISVPLVGDILAAGKSPETLAEGLSLELEKYIRSPQVTVVITQPSSSDFLQRVRITGAVNTPTSAPYRKGMTVLDLVLLAGGTNDFASGNKANLYRSVGGTTKVYPIYLNDILNKGKLESNYKLLPSDVVTVPERAF